VSHGKTSGAIRFALNFLWLLSLLQGKESDIESSVPRVQYELIRAWVSLYYRNRKAHGIAVFKGMPPTLIIPIFIHNAPNYFCTSNEESQTHPSHQSWLVSNY
jgi:hypothetical protein